MTTTTKQYKDFSPEDIANQILKAVEVADISDFHGKNVFEAGDYDTIYQSIVDGIKKYGEIVRTEERERAIEIVKEALSDIERFNGEGIVTEDMKSFGKIVAKDILVVLSTKTTE